MPLKALRAKSRLDSDGIVPPGSPAEFVKLDRPQVDWDDVILPQEVKRNVQNFIETWPDVRRTLEGIATGPKSSLVTPPVMLFHGASGSGKTLLAKAVAAKLGKPLLEVGLDGGGHFSSIEVVRAALDEAEKSDSIVFIDEAHEYLSSDSKFLRAFLVELDRCLSFVILATSQTDTLDTAVERRILLKVELPDPDLEARTEILKRHLPKGVNMAPDVDLQKAARLYVLTGGDLRNLMTLTTLEAVKVSKGQSKPVIGWKELDRAASIVTHSSFSDVWRTGALMPAEESGQMKLQSWAEQILAVGKAHFELQEKAMRGQSHPWKDMGLKVLVQGYPSHGVHGQFDGIIAQMGVGYAYASVIGAIIETKREKVTSRRRKQLEEIFDSDLLSERLVLLLDHNEDLVKVLSIAPEKANDEGKILDGFLRFKGMGVLVSQARTLHPEWRAKFHLVLDAGSTGQIPTDAWNSLVRADVPLKLNEQEMLQKLGLNYGDVLKAAFHAWVKSVADGKGKKITQEEFVRAARIVRCEGRSERPFFGGSAT